MKKKTKNNDSKLPIGIMDVLSKKQLRGFKDLNETTQVELLQTQLINKVSQVLGRNTTNSMIDGIRIAEENIYKRYVEPHDNETDIEKKSLIVEQLLSYLRLKHVEHIKRQHEKEKAEQEQKVNEA